METVKRNVMMSKSGGNSGKDTLNYKIISLPAGAIKALGITPEKQDQPY